MSVSTEYAIETSCIRRMKKTTGSHKFRITGYSLDKDTDRNRFLESTIFNVGGYDWNIRYYPNGSYSAKDGEISIFVSLKTQEQSVKAQVSLTILHQNGSAFRTSTSDIIIFSYPKDSWGSSSFAKRAELESNIKDDCFIIEAVVTVFQVFPVEPTEPIVVPPSNILEQLGQLLEGGNGVDVTFEVDGQTFNAHKCILAARSPVFFAQFFGAMKENSDSNIKIKEIEAPVFKALLHFIYTDSFPGLEAKKGSDEKHDIKLMAQHLLVAADRYGLERLKIICEKILWSSIDKSNVVHLLALAERHNCNHLKTSCLKFLVTADIFGDVLESYEFQQLIKNYHISLKEQLQKRLKPGSIIWFSSHSVLFLLILFFIILLMKLFFV